MWLPPPYTLVSMELAVDDSISTLCGVICGPPDWVDMTVLPDCSAVRGGVGALSFELVAGGTSRDLADIPLLLSVGGLTADRVAPFSDAAACVLLFFSGAARDLLYVCLLVAVPDKAWPRCGCCGAADREPDATCAFFDPDLPQPAANLLGGLAAVAEDALFFAVKALLPALA